MRSKKGEIDVLTRYKMSSALASARKRSIPQPGQQPPLPGKTIGQVQTNGVNASNGNPANAPTGGGQLTLAQIIDVYGRRILQLEKQVLELSGNPLPNATGGRVGVDPASLAAVVIAQVSSVIDAKIAGANDSRLDESVDSKITELVEARLKDFASREFVPVMEELNSRHEVLAKEILELKDLLLNLQSFTMTTHKKILDIALEPFEIVGTTQGDNILDDIQEGVDEEVDEEHASILADLEKSLASIPEEYEMNPGISVANSEAKSVANDVAEQIASTSSPQSDFQTSASPASFVHIVKRLAKSIEESVLENVVSSELESIVD